MTDGVVAAPAAATAASNGQTAQGQTADNTASGVSKTGNQAPVVSNVAPVHVETPAEKATREAQAVQVAAEQAATKKAADDEAARAAAVDPSQVSNQTTGDFKLEPTGNRGLDAALAMCQGKGMTQADFIEVFGKVKATGNIADMNYQFLVNKVGDGMAAVVQSGLEAQIAGAQAATALITKTASDAVGGDAQWSTLKTWFQAKEKSDPQFATTAKELRALLHKGGIQTQMTAKHIAELHKADPNSKGLNNANLTRGTNATQTGTQFANRADYVKQLETANRAGNHQEMNRLQQAWRTQNGR